MLTKIFPLQAEVWGTVSDWIMIGVTAVTAIFLYKTLKSQKDVQRSQQRITEIEEHRHRESIMPQFELDLIIEEEVLINDEFNIIFHIQFTNKGEAAKNVEVIINRQDDRIEGNLIMSQETVNKELFMSQAYLKTKRKAYSSVDEKTKAVTFYYTMVLFFELTFSDQEHQKYSQGILLTQMASGQSIRHELPIKV